MTKLILHVGPAKCGSTSIQRFFFTQKDPCVEKTHYLLLDPKEIRDLDSEKPAESIIASYTKLFSEKAAGCDTLILSHEFLFQCPHAIKNICDLAEPFVEEITVIGYSRQQGDFLVSAYSQWHFRSLPRIKMTTDTLSKLDIDPILFSGLEQQLIASIENNFSASALQDWYNSYKKISQLVCDANIVIKCGVLPKKGSNISLIQDFCETANLTLKDDAKEASWVVANPSFSQEVVEAINNAVHLGLVDALDFQINNIAQNKTFNDAIALLSNKVNTRVINHQSFLSELKAYINTYYLVSNHQLCNEYNLDETYFAPLIEYSKQDILDIIVQEAQKRSVNKLMIINEYRVLSAEMADLSLKLAFEIAELEKQGRILHKKNQLLMQSSKKSLVLRLYRKLYAKLAKMYQRLALYQTDNGE